LPLSTSRRRFLQGSTAVAATGALAVLGDGVIFEANRPQVVSVEIPLSRLSEAWDGFRIAQLSDLHYDDHFSVVPIRKAVDLVKSLKPDLIVLTGDFITSPFVNRRPLVLIKAAKAIEPCAQILAEMQAPFGVLATLGNHDVSTDPAHITAALEAQGVAVLRNRAVPLERNGARLWLSGLDDVLEGKYDLKLTLKDVPPTEPVVLLAHEPDFADYAHHVDLQLSGHSHGGQIRLPGIGAPVLPVMGRKYPKGLRRIGPLTLYTNVGVGTVIMPMRLNCPPEVTLITLRATPGAATRS
jgi:predicted MPP superfamily phosphohydrolase